MRSRLLPVLIGFGGLLALFSAGLGWVMPGNDEGRGLLPLPNVSAEVLAAPKAGLTLRDVRELPEAEWAPWNKAGFAPAAPDHSVWVRVTLRNPGPGALQGVLENTDPHADRVELFGHPESGGSLLSGEAVSAGERATEGRRVAFPLTLPAGSHRTVYLRFEDHFKVWLHPAWWPRQEAFYAASSRQTLAQGFYFGILLALIFYNAVLWVRVRFPDTGLYLLCLTTFTVAAFLGGGGVSEFRLCLGSPWREAWTTVALVLSGAFLAEFARTLLDLPSWAKRADRITRAARNFLIALAPVALVATLAGQTELLSYFVLACGINHLLLLAVAVSAWRKGREQARYLVLAFSVLILGVAPALAIWVDAVPLELMARAAMAGSALQMLLLSVATAHRFALIQRDKMKVQEALFEETAQREAIQEAYADELQTEVKERTSELYSANADKDRMIAVLGHDLRAPLTALTQTAELLTRNATPARLERFAGDAARTGSQMLLLIEDLVLWTQLRAGTGLAAACGVSSIVAPVVALHHVFAEREGVEVAIDAAPGTYVVADLVLTQTLVRNLVANAVKFASTRVLLQVTRQNGFVRLAVIDDGPGLPSHLAAQLTAAAPWSSSGLGLRFCREIAEFFAIKIHVATPPGGGTEISFLLPEAPAP